MIQPKYFLDPVCGWGNTCERYIKERLPEIIHEFKTETDAIKYICENEIYMFNYKNQIDTLEAKLLLKYKYNADNTHVYYIEWSEKLNICSYFNLIKEILIKENFKNIDKNGMPKFDYIIQNPPYKGSLHLLFLNEGINMLAKTGKMVIIEPSTWLINLRKTGKAKSIYIPLKKKLEGHVKSINIENLNKEFNICVYMPLSITTIDFSRTYDEIDFTCCGEHKKLKSLFDCNLIGNYNLIWSILNKCLSYKDMMINHIYTKQTEIKNENIYFAKYIQMIGRSFCGDPRWSDVWFRNNLYAAPIYFTLFDDRVDISKKPYMALKSGYTYTNPKFTDKLADNIFGTKKELENWKYNVYNTTLFPFINICLITDQSNTSKNFIPWLVDKKYTNEEIYKLFNFTKEEIDLIENTIKKYDKKSEWFVRYMYGKNWKKYCKEF